MFHVESLNNIHNYLYWSVGITTSGYDVSCMGLLLLIVTFSVTNIFQTPNRGSSDNGNSRHLIPDSPICTSSHFMISLDQNVQGDDPASYMNDTYTKQIANMSAQ